MARDIKIQFKPKLSNAMPEPDFEFAQGDLVRDEGLETSVLISLFSDRRAENTDNYDNDDKKGWFGDLVSGIEDDKIGSRLYLLDRAKVTEDSLIRAKEYIYEALSWMLEDNVCANIEIDTWLFGPVESRRMGILIKIYKQDGNTVAMKFDDLWKYTYTIGIYNAV